MTHSSTQKSGAVGFVLILIGALFLFKNLDLIPYEISNFLFNWKGIVLLIGSVIIFTKPNKMPGIIMVSIASFFIVTDALAYEFGWYAFDIRKMFWPVILIIVGLVFITRKKRSNRPFFDHRSCEQTTVDTDFLNINTAMGGGDITFTSKNFSGGKVSTLMGGGTYDLSNCEMAEGVQEIDISVIFGGASFIVPSDWNVRIEVTSIFGGFNDSRKKILEPTVGKKELLIRGTVIFGGGEVKNFV